MSGPTSADLSGLARLSREHGLDLRQVTLRVQTDLFVTAPRRDAATIESFGLLATGLLAAVDDAAAETVARKLAPVADTPEAVLVALVRRGGGSRRAVIEAAPVLTAAVQAAAVGDGTDLGPIVAARPDLSRRAIEGLVSRADPAIDRALAANPRAVLRGAALAELIRRGRERTELAHALLDRDDLGAVDRAPLYLSGCPEQRLAILDGIASLAAVRRPHWVSGPVNRSGCERLIELAADRQEALFAARLALLLDVARPFSWDWREESHQDLLALALLTLGVPEEDAIRIFLTLSDAIALSVQAVFRLVKLLRTTAPATAAHVLEAVWGDGSPRAAGQHVPALEPLANARREEPTRRVRTGREAAAQHGQGGA